MSVTEVRIVTNDLLRSVISAVIKFGGKYERGAEEYHLLYSFNYRFRSSRNKIKYNNYLLRGYLRMTAVYLA